MLCGDFVTTFVVGDFDGVDGGVCCFSTVGGFDCETSAGFKSETSGAVICLVGPGSMDNVSRSMTGIYFLKNFLFLRVTRPEPSTLTIY